MTSAPERWTRSHRLRLKCLAGITLLILGAFGCSSTNDVFTFGGQTMGTTYQVSLVPPDSPSDEFPPAVDALLDDINQSMSTYMESSLISGINAARDTDAWHAVDPHFESVFLRSREIYEDTDGAFNPAVGPLVNAWGFGPDGPKDTPDDETLTTLRALSDFGAFGWRPSPPSLRKPDSAAALDFSAIAKGYGVDQVGLLLEERGVSSYFVEIGGEVRTRGMHPAGRPWRVGIERPDPGNDRGDLQAILSLHDAALATSGNYRNFTVRGGERIVHILNPASGRPEASALLSASVLAEDTATADAYATAFMVMGADRAMAFVEARDGLEAYFISSREGGGYVEQRSSGFPEH